MDKRLVNLTTLLVFLWSLTNAFAGDNINHTNTQNRLIMVQGRVLNVYFNGQYKEIKRAGTFYGYGWLDDHRVFVAYQPEGWAEASARTEVIDVQQPKSFSLGEIGDTGESNFDVNPDTKEIIFNGPEGIELMTVDLQNLSKPKLSRHIRLIKKIDPEKDESVGWGVFWIDSRTIGYLNLTSKQLIKINIKESL